MNSNLLQYLLGFAAFALLKTVYSSTIGELDLTLKGNEKLALDKFKLVVADNKAIPPELRDKEAYLIRWLRASNFNVRKAEKMLVENRRWRNKFKMDKIHDENWSDFDREYPFDSNSFDRNGQPVVFTEMGLWDMRKAIMSGQREKLLRYIFKMLDTVDVEVTNQQEKGVLVTRGNIVVNIEGYNFVQHFCAGCIPMYVEMIHAMENHFPFLFDKMILINAPTAFETLLNIIKQAMKPETKESLQVFGRNRPQWGKYLRDIIDEEQIPVEFGGLKFHDETNDNLA